MECEFAVRFNYTLSGMKKITKALTTHMHFVKCERNFRNKFNILVMIKMRTNIRPVQLCLRFFNIAFRFMKE